MRPPGRADRRVPGGPPANHSRGEAFILQRATYLGRAALEPICRTNVLPQIGDSSDEHSIRCGLVV
jgi:hypothetical protein